MYGVSGIFKRSIIIRTGALRSLASNCRSCNEPRRRYSVLTMVAHSHQAGDLGRHFNSGAASASRFDETMASSNNSVRVERDSLGEVAVPADRLWGAQTQRSLENFSIGGVREVMPAQIIHSLAIVKLAAARVNTAAGKIQTEHGNAIIAAAESIVAGKYMDHFPLVVWQTGSGTQSNMNMNEVIANIAIRDLGGIVGSKQPVHPNDHVNYAQSSNDVFPTAMHISTALEITNNLLPTLDKLANALMSKEKAFEGIIKIGRTHLQDATPMTLGQEFGSFAATVRNGVRRIKYALESVFQLAQGGTAVGTGLNCYDGFAETFAMEVARITELPFVSAPNKFEALSGIGPMVEISSALATIAADLLKISNDIRLLSSGPRGGLAELLLPANEPGSSIMPGKVNPTQCEALSMVCAEILGNHTTVSICSSHGHLQLNVFRPVVALNVLRSISLMNDAITCFVDRCVMGIEPNRVMLAKHVSNSLMLATALAPHIGYDNCAKTVLHAHRNNLTLLEAALDLGTVTEETFKSVVRPETMISSQKRE